MITTVFIVVCVILFCWKTKSSGSQLFRNLGNLPKFVYFLILRAPEGVLPPSYPGKLPLLGNIWSLLGDGKLMTDPDDAVIVANHHLDKPYIYDFAKPWVANGLITANGAIWKPSRKAIAPAFSAKVLHDFLPVFNDTSRRFVAGMSENVNKGYFNPWTMVVRSLLHNICHTIFGLQNGESNVIEEYSHTAENLLSNFCERLFKFWLHIPIVYKYSFLKKTIDDMCKAAITLISEIISKQRKIRLDTSRSDVTYTESYKSLLDYLLDFNEKHKFFKDDEIRAHLDTMTVAAFDTTSSAITFLMCLIGSHPNVQTKIQEELAKIYEDSTRDVDKHDLAKMVYLEAVIKESLRLYPPVPLVLRASDDPVKLKRYTLPPKSIYAISIYAINRHPMWGKDAEEFRPERWLEPGGIPDNPNAFISFSLGKRNCIGKYYALTYMKITMAHLFRKYRVTSDINKVVLNWDVTLRPVTGHEIAIQEI